jgi:hypothetical protein
MDSNNTVTIEKLYKNLSYFDLYGSSVIFIIIVTILLILFCLYCSAKINSQQIKKDWINQRCKPNVMPFAGYINKPPNMSASNFTKQNFDYCVQQNVTGMTGHYLQPLNFINSTLYFTSSLLINSVTSSFDMINKMKELFVELMRQIKKLFSNILIPIQKIILAFKDTFGKLAGILVASVYSFIGAYYTIRSIMEVIARALVRVLIIMAAIVLLMWLTPFTWGAAATGTVVLTAVAIPLAIFLDFFVKVFHVDLGLTVPKINSGKKMKCFDENTILNMNDGTTKTIKDILPGDVLENNNEVTGIFKVLTEGSELYDLNGVIVSDTHMVKYNNEWLRVCKHPFSRKLAFYENKPYLYCLNTVSKTIIINDVVFSDWDEIYDENVALLSHKLQGDFVSGFASDSPIILKNGDIKKISEIKVGEVLEKGEKVYGIVKIDGSNCEQFIYKLGKNMVAGGPNLIMCDKKYFTSSTIDLDEKYKNKRGISDEYLFHLLTDKKTFKVNNVEFGDYNSSIDFFIN